jgi:excisionase family DNA binding protein
MTFPSDIPNKGTGTALLSSAEVSKRLKVSAKSIYKWMDEGNFPPSIRLGHMHRWRESDIEAWLERGGSDVPSSS